MLEIWRRIVISSAIAVYVAGLACAGGALVERVRSGEARVQVLSSYTEAAQQRHLIRGPIGKATSPATKEIE